MEVSMGKKLDRSSDAAARAQSWLGDAGLTNERVRQQVDQMVDGLRREGPVLVLRADGEPLPERAQWGEAAYVVRGGSVLLDPDDVGTVRETLKDLLEGDGTVEPIFDGVARMAVPDPVRAVRTAQERLNRRALHLEYALHVTNTSYCPATEPLPPGRRSPTGRRWSCPHCDGHGVKVAVVDSGFDPLVASTTAWLGGVQGDAETLTDPLGPYLGHGTFIAGVVRMMAPAAEVYVHGTFPVWGAEYESTIVRKLIEAAKSEPDIISLSAGTTTLDDGGLYSFDVWWKRHACKKTVLVAAAGNNGNDVKFYPAAADYAIGVGAVDKDGTLAAYSCFGEWVDVYARGSDVVNAYPRGRYRYVQAPLQGTSDVLLPAGLARWSGTSFATPMVAGVIAARMTGQPGTAPATADTLVAHAHQHAFSGLPVVRKRDADD